LKRRRVKIQHDPPHETGVRPLLARQSHSSRENGRGENNICL
jgi:hypothetical protein